MAVYGIELDADGEQVGELVSVLAEFLAVSPNGELSVPYGFAADGRGVYFTMIRAVSIGFEFTFCRHERVRVPGGHDGFAHAGTCCSPPLDGTGGQVFNGLWGLARNAVLLAYIERESRPKRRT